MNNLESLWIDHVKTDVACDMAESHAHQTHELYFLLSGERRYLIGHTLYNVSAGDLVIIPKKCIHRTTVLNNKGYERYVIYFSDDALTELKNLIGQDCLNDIMQRGCIPFSPTLALKVQKLFEQFEAEHLKNDTYTKAMKQSLLHQILLLAIRYGTAKPRALDQCSDRIQRTAQYISENYASDITLHAAAKIAFMEATYFSRCFKKQTGFGFNEYLTQARLNAAEELLENTKLSISEISERCGFSSSNYFGDVYKKRNGFSPSSKRR